MVGIIVSLLGDIIAVLGVLPVVPKVSGVFALPDD